MSGEVRDNRAEGRYELAADGDLAIVDYRREGDRVVFTHTAVPHALEGRGIGTRLIQGALADVRRQGLKVVPACAFVAAYMKRHPEEQDLLAS